MTFKISDIHIYTDPCAGNTQTSICGHTHACVTLVIRNFKEFVINKLYLNTTSHFISSFLKIIYLFTYFHVSFEVMGIEFRVSYMLTKFPTTELPLHLQFSRTIYSSHQQEPLYAQIYLLTFTKSNRVKENKPKTYEWGQGVVFEFVLENIYNESQLTLARKNCKYQMPSTAYFDSHLESLTFKCIIQAEAETAYVGNAPSLPKSTQALNSI